MRTKLTSWAHWTGMVLC